MDNFNYTKYLADGKLVKEDRGDILLKQKHLSPAEYQRAKKEKGFNGKDFWWDAKKDLYTNNTINEGVWKIGNPDDIKNFIEHTKEMKNDYWSVVGSDEVMDGLDMAIKGAEELLFIKSKQ